MRALLATLALLLVACGPVAPHPPLPSSVSSLPSAACPAFPTQAIYHPRRLQILNPCVVVTGTVLEVIVEKDGDLHIWMAVDAPYTNLLNAKNMFHGQPALVAEIICFGVVTQADAMQACAGWNNTLPAPGVGNRLGVKGPHVFDHEHGWQEVHPVSQTWTP